MVPLLAQSILESVDQGVEHLALAFAQGIGKILWQGLNNLTDLHCLLQYGKLPQEMG
jgi:hypothetical protein